MLGVLGFEIGEEKVKKSKKNETYLLNLPLHVSGESPGWARNEAGEAPASYGNFLKHTWQVARLGFDESGKTPAPTERYDTPGESLGSCYCELGDPPVTYGDFSIF